MSVFRSAMGYFSSASNGASGGGEPGSELVGAAIDVAGLKLRVRRLIAEGGFAFVFVAQDTASGTEYALKRLMAADRDANKNIVQEISLLKKLSGHPNIIKYVGASFIDNTKTSHGMSEYLLLTDLCTGGSLMEALQNRGSAFPVSTILRIFYQACRSVQHMHAQVPPIAHRDLKLENFLITSEGTIKLCDFGSATTEVHSPDTSWNVNQRTMLEETLTMFTTPMYRAPEMLDTWDNHQIDHSVDIWALGCILYTLCYMQHPFEDSAKLAILNGNYNLNQNDQQYKCFHEIIRGCLTVNPENRLTINGVLERLAAIAESTNVNLKQPLKFERKKVEQSVATSSPGTIPVRDNAKTNVSNTPVRPPSRPPEPARPPMPAAAPLVTNDPPPPRPTPPVHQQQTPQPAGLFSSLKGGAGSFLKNLKDTSSKVMQTVQQTIARSDLDISYITGRVAVMPYPSEGIESAYKTNHIDDVRAFLESRHPAGKCLIVNVSGKSSGAMFPAPNRTIDVFISQAHHSPTLRSLFMSLRHAYKHLEKDEKNVCVVTCQDGKSVSCILVCALMLYCRLITVPEDGLQIFAVRRCPPNMQPSQLRYLYYLTNIIRPEPSLPHYKPVTLMSLAIQPVPLFTKVRDGCRPYVEVYNNDRCVLSTLQDYDKLHLFNVTEGKCMLQLNTTVAGDVLIVVYHARHQLGRPTGIRMFQIQFHTGYIPQDQIVLRFNRSEMDDIGEGNDHFPGGISASVGVLVAGTDGRPPIEPDPWTQDDTFYVRSSQVIFTTTLERDETVDNFVTVVRSRPRPARPAPPSPQPPRRPPPPEVLSDQMKTMNVDVQADSVKLNQETTDMLNIAGEQSADISQTATTDTFDLFANFPPPPSKTAQLNEPKINQNANLLFPEDDTFGDFLSNVSSNSTSVADNSGLGDFINASGNSSDAFDPFGLATPQKLDGNNPLLTPNVMNSAAKNSATNGKQSSEQTSTKRDPFIDLCNLGSNNGNQAPPTVPQVGPTGAWNSGENSASASRLSSPIHRPAATPSPSHQPDYSRSHFEPPKAPADKIKKPGDVFGDLLGSQGYEFAARKDQGPRTINQMRKGEIMKEMDPERLLIHDWAEGKKSNIRALLCSLHTIVWENCRWSKCDMGAIVDPNDVKKAYRRACLAIHPDKQVGTENENIAKLIFMELNNAWSDFENDEKQQNLFQS
ncbi:cyclin-G-associated kinase [Arctopsyche grandis]|uniref:cyclin-G-associated kinase n=1 Tax=Arctopsyche grandis TaxID=121162 RepID=UPI00406D6651